MMRVLNQPWFAVTAIAAVLWLPAMAPARAQAVQPGAEIVRAAPSQPQFSSQPGPRSNQEHLAQWMQIHRNLTPQQQQQALQQEPGFQQLPVQTQQRMLGRLSQLNAMGPQQRTHVLERAEEMERLSPPQRQQVRSAMAELGRLPPDRRRIVAHVFRDLRDMPRAQRQGYLSSDYLHRELSPSERLTLTNLLAVEPLLPPQHSAAYPQIPGNDPANQQPMNQPLDQQPMDPQGQPNSPPPQR